MECQDALSILECCFDYLKRNWRENPFMYHRYVFRDDLFKRAYDSKMVWSLS